MKETLQRKWRDAMRMMRMANDFPWRRRDADALLTAFDRHVEKLIKELNRGTEQPAR